jgi:hypothetical protein
MKKRYLRGEFLSPNFTHLTRCQGVDYDFTLERARDKAITQSPNARLMLLSWLAREFATEKELPDFNQNFSSLEFRVKTVISQS